MIYDIEISDQAEIDLRGIFEYIANGCCFFHAWRNLGFFYAHFYGRRYRPWLTESWVLLLRLAEIQQPREHHPGGIMGI